MNNLWVIFKISITGNNRIEKGIIAISTSEDILKEKIQEYLKKFDMKIDKFYREKSGIMYYESNKIHKKCNSGRSYHHYLIFKINKIEIWG